MHFRMEAGKAHEESRPGASVTEDKEFLARKELLDLGDFFRRDRRDGITVFLCGIALDENAGGGFEARKHSCEISSYRFQFSMTSPTRQTRIPKIFTQEILSLKMNIATGTKIRDATTLTSTAAMPRCQPAR